jgi:hypothetical protein
MRVVAVVPRTAAGEILALRGELVARALDQPRERHFALQPLDLLIGDACHRGLRNRTFAANPVKRVGVQ